MEYKSLKLTYFGQLSGSLCARELLVLHDTLIIWINIIFCSISFTAIRVIVLKEVSTTN